MFRKLVVSDGDIDNVLTKALAKIFDEPGLTDEEIIFYKGVAMAVEWMVDVDADEPEFENS